MISSPKIAHFASILFGLFVSLSAVNSIADSASYTAAPPFVATQVGDPNVVIALDISGSMKQCAYTDPSISKWKTDVHQDFSPSNKYFGYFDSASKYSYYRSTDEEFFYQDATGTWDGKFLNWLTMRRMDVVRKVLVGGKVKDRAGTTVNGEQWFIVEGQNEPLDYTFTKTYALSSTVSPFPDNTEVKISDGSFSATTGDQSNIVALSEKVEIGTISLDRKISNDGWRTVNFKNTYTSTPAVVATALSYNGANQSLARVNNITLTSFDVKIDEWDYLDGNHTTETVTFVVAEPGTHDINLIDNDGNPFTKKVDAGTITATSVYSNFHLINFKSNLPSNPVLFTGVTSFNDPMPVTTRVRNISTSTFEVTLQEEKSEGANGHGGESVSWVGFEEFVGRSAYSDVQIQVASTNNVHTEVWQDVNFEDDHFTKVPIVAINLQTSNGGDPVVARYGDDDVTTEKFDVKMEEENSDGSGDLTHPAAEAIGFLAVETESSYKIRIGEKQLPTGIVQQNAGSVRFGVAVYNYDHSVAPTSIYNSNKVNGGTLAPCYPDVSKPVSEQTNFDICLDTHVKAPIDNIIAVIEDHPLIWGTTPIAETLYDIWGYFKQEDFNVNGHTQWYDNGTEGLSGNAISDGQPKSRNSYEISEEWDPYYYDEYDAYLPCAKSFVLHFNDGAPYKDFDLPSSGISPHPTLTNDGVGPSTSEQALDDLALELRKEDCRSDNGLAGHQEIVSYYVYAALGQEDYKDDDDDTRTRDNNVKRMLEAAVNGGFVDNNGDNAPTPLHVEDMFTYYTNSTCTPNEWDEDGDCTPDTFYYASDAEDLITQLNAALASITARAGSGGSASVIAASRSGEGAVYNAIFRPSINDPVSGQEVTWIGDVHALMIDSAGNLRHDSNDNKTLDSTDNYIDMCSYDDGSTKEVRIRLSDTDADRPDRSQSQACLASIFNVDLFDLDYLWSGASWLSALGNASTEVSEQLTALEDNRSYNAKNGRYIFTGFDSDGDGLVEASEGGTNHPFTVDYFGESLAGLISGDLDTTHNVVNFIRGIEDTSTGFRSRNIGGEIMRLGDVIYSTPTVVGRPAENFDLIYGSSSYRSFFEKYKDRRHVVYAGANDGLLHAFNAGWYNSTTKTFQDNPASTTTDFELGQEIWAYAPYNLLNHLEYLTRPAYGAAPSDHLYFVDLKPRVFDAKIFTDDGANGTHPGGWGTVMVVGSRLGGGLAQVDAHVNGGDARTLRSSYSIFDVTDPEQPPVLLMEFTHPDLGFTTAAPTPVFDGNDKDGDGDWYLLLGSGADTTPEGFDEVKSTRNGKLFMLDLNTIGKGQAVSMVDVLANTYTLSESNSFVSDLTAVDIDLSDFATDAVYFGTVSGDESGWAGQVHRMDMTSSNWAPSLVYNAARPITAPVSTAVDDENNRWLHVGSGRFYTQTDNTDKSRNYFLGIKEPRNNDGSFKFSTVTSLVDVTSTQVVSQTGKLANPPTLSPGLGDEPSLADLEQRFTEYGNDETYVDGWLRQMDQGERNFGAATIFGGTLTYTTFNPEFDTCSIEGDSSLYVLNVLTGTAGERAILTQADNDPYNAYKEDLGSSPATSPSIHIGDGYVSDNKANAIIQTADGAITTVEQSNKDKVRSGETSWRQLQ